MKQIISILFFCLFFSCKKESEIISNKGNIKGKVIDGNTGKGIASVNISAINSATNTSIPNMLTDADGVFTITSLSEGTYKFTFSKNGYDTKTASVSIKANATSEQEISLLQSSSTTPNTIPTTPNTTTPTNYFTVTYDADGGWGINTNGIKIVAGGIHIINSNSSFTPTKGGYLFMGFIINNDNTKLFKPSESITINSDTKIVAKWVSRWLVVIDPGERFDIGVGMINTKTFTIKNTGNSTLNISKIETTDPTFSVDWTSTEIVAGGSKNLVISFNPIKLKFYESMLKVYSNSTSNGTDASGNALPTSINLYGTGLITSTAKTFTISSNNLGFGTVKVGYQSSSNLLIIKNVGTLPITFSNIRFSGGINSSYIITDISNSNSSFTIQPNEDWRVAIAFKPKTANYTNGSNGSYSEISESLLFNTDYSDNVTVAQVKLNGIGSN